MGRLFARRTGKIYATWPFRNETRKVKMNVSGMSGRLSRETDDRIWAEESLRHLQRMAAIGQLTGGLSHDFNNILATISGSLELLSRHVARERIVGLDGYIETSMSAVNQAEALTQRLLALARRQTLDPKVVDLNQVIGGMEDIIHSTAGPFIKVELKLADSIWLTSCDSNQVGSALLNLAINARDAMPDGGHLTFQTMNLSLGSREETENILETNLLSGDYVGLSVTDTGHGMSASVLKHALDPFFTTKPVGQGTGLGLSIIDSFARQSGGNVHLESKVGHGTTVTIYFPRFSNALSPRATNNRAEQGLIAS